MPYSSAQLKAAVLATFGYNATRDAAKDARIVDAVQRGFVQACVDSGNAYAAGAARTSGFDLLWERAAMWKAAEILEGGERWVDYYNAYRQQLAEYRDHPPKIGDSITPP